MAQSTNVQQQTHPLLSEVVLPNPNNHDRLFHTLHGAEILAESGAGYEAARVTAAIANLEAGGPPAEEAKRRLQRWGLSIEEIEQLPAVQINQRVAASFAGEPSGQPHWLHFRNLIDLGLLPEATEYLLRISNEMERQIFIEQWGGLVSKYGVPLQLPDAASPMTEMTAKRWVETIHRQRQLWRNIQRLWFTDREVCELALQLWLHSQGPDAPLPEHFHIDRHRPFHEVLGHILERTEQMVRDRSRNYQQAIEVLQPLLQQVAPGAPQTRQFQRIVNELDSERAHEPTNDFGDQQPASRRTRSDFEVRNRLNPIEDKVIGGGIFDSPAVQQYRLELKAESADRLQQDPRSYVTATFYHGDQIYPNVGVRLKGGAGSFREFNGEEKIGLTIKFNEFEKEQRFHGLRRIVLNNAVQDASYLNEYLGYNLFRQAGIPAPRVTYAFLQINDQAYGLYVQPEAVTKDFLSAWFTDPSGNLYEGPGDVMNWEGLDLDTNQKDNDRSDLRRLVQTIEQADDLNPWPTLSSQVDLPNLAKFVALEQLTGHWDGFSACNNYRIYHSPDQQKFFLIPHGADQLFVEVNRPIFHPQESVLGRALLQTQFGRDVYLDAVEWIMNEYWNEESLKKQIGEVYLRISPIIESGSGRGRNQQLEFEQVVRRTIEYIELRRTIVMAQLENESFNSWRQRRPHLEFPPFLREN